MLVENDFSLEGLLDQVPRQKHCLVGHNADLFKLVFENSDGNLRIGVEFVKEVIFYHVLGVLVPLQQQPQQHHSVFELVLLDRLHSAGIDVAQTVSLVPSNCVFRPLGHLASGLGIDRFEVCFQLGYFCHVAL